MNQPSTSFEDLRVCVVGPFPPRDGDLATQTDLLCQCLEEEGAQVRRVNTDVPRVRRLPVLGIHLLPLVQVPALLWRLLWAARVSDVVHVQAASYWAFFLPVTLALVVGRLFSRRVVISYSGSLAATFLERFQRIVWPMLRRMDGIAVSSAFLQEIFQRYGLDTAIVPNMIQPEQFPFRERDAWPPLILWMNTLERDSNPAMALRAFRLLRGWVAEARLLLVGRGVLAEEVGARARELGLAGAIAYRPWLPLHRRRRAIQDASVVWNTASHDNFSQVLLEAAASGTVVVSTDVGAVGELLHDGVDALLVEPNDDERMAAATAQVLRRAVLAEGLAANARISADRYTWPVVRAEVARLYGLPVTEAVVVQPGEAADDHAALASLGGGLVARTEYLWSEGGRGIREPVPGPDEPAEPADQG